MDRLPAPDMFGNYWLGERSQPPAILTRKHGEEPGYMVLASTGVMFAGPNIKRFETPQDALKVLRILEAKAKYGVDVAEALDRR